ncbi:MAG TPA: PilT/PilU family type 4a pilus ATPase [Egibacteraceae bacterium]|nr:PilT/PilU family type 4a pilus ATPase [Egibacteraceae bacterium]
MSKGLADVLVGQGVIEPDVLEQALAQQRAEGTTLGRVLVRMGAVTEQQIVAAIARQMGVPFADCSPGAVDTNAAMLLPRSEAQRLTALPVQFTPDNGLLVAMVDPTDQQVLERVTQCTGMRAHPALAVRADLETAIVHLTDDETPPVPNSKGSAPPSVATGAPASDDDKLLLFEKATTLDLDGALLALVERGGSDLHLTAGVPPTIRVHGELQPLEGHEVLNGTDLQQAIYALLTQKQREQFENTLELDLSYSIPGRARFRVNVFQQRDAIGAVMRVIPFEIKSIEELAIPKQVGDFAKLPRGFVLVTGPTGSGKSTTLAALIDMINRERACHIMTVEDPIEFLHEHKRSVINQRELGTDTLSFASALKHVLRQDPDVILVGEMRDLETIQVALTAAETGHLVFGTLHTQDAPQTVDRVIDVFPPHQQEQIRVMLAGSLQGVVCQQLLKTRDGKGRIAACEVMVATSGIRNLIREGKTHQMYSALQAGASHGMVTMDQSLATLVKQGKVSYDAALERCNQVADFKRLVGEG